MFAEMREGSEQLVVIRAFSHPHEAHLACSALAAASLDATVADAHIVAADWLMSNAVGGVKVVVRAEDARAAREVLHEPAVVNEDDQGNARFTADDSSTRCSRCGSERILRATRGRAIAVFTRLAAGVPLFPVWRQLRCARCGHRLDEV